MEKLKENLKVLLEMAVISNVEGNNFLFTKFKFNGAKEICKKIIGRLK